MKIYTQPQVEEMNMQLDKSVMDGIIISSKETTGGILSREREAGAFDYDDEAEE